MPSPPDQDDVARQRPAPEASPPQTVHEPLDATRVPVASTAALDGLSENPDRGLASPVRRDP